jgi:hypothetical protein
VSHRYAVLWETAPDHRARPAGLVVEQDDHVLVEARDELCLPRRYEQPFQVVGPDMTPVQYRPQDPQYFDQVLLDLSRGFIIGNEGRVHRATEGVILGLLAEHVFRVLRRDEVVLYYNTAGDYPTVRAYQERYYRGGGASDTSTEPEPATHEVAAGSYVVA